MSGAAGTLVRRPQPGSPLGFASWAREAGALARCMVFGRVRVPDGAPPGDGHGVLVIPGFLTGDWSTAPLRRVLETLGYRVEHAGTLVNLGPTRRFEEKLSAKLDALAAAGPVTLIGQSLGGVMARELAKRCPDRVRRVVTICSPVNLPVETVLYHFVGAAHGAFGWNERLDTADVAAPPPVPLTAFFSREDGIVDWRATLPAPAPGVEAVEIGGPHCTSASNPKTLETIAARLAADAPAAKPTKEPQ